MLTAWGDESGSNPVHDPDTYLIGTALVEDSDVPTIRKAMESVRLPGEKKVHWHGSTDARRQELIAVVAELPIAGFVVVRSESGANDRRHRRKCLEFLLPSLAGFDCRSVTLESRGQQDESDRDLLSKFRARQLVTGTLRLEHAVGRTEPALAVADIVCGAVVQARVGNPRYLDYLGRSIEVNEL